MELVVHGPNPAPSLASVRIPADRVVELLGAEAPPVRAQPVMLRELDGGRPVPAQFDAIDGLLWFVAPTLADSDTSIRMAPTDERVPGEQTWAGFEERLDRVCLTVASRPFATYVVRGTRRPYFWPVLGPAGASVVRGQGSGDHPHHTGLAVNYGGHAEGGSVNIWSDWDEPPYGPGGRMLHGGFRTLASGPVFGQLVEDVAYLDPDGVPIASEVRTVRWWWGSSTARYLDFIVAVDRLDDAGTSPFIVMARSPESFDIPGTGQVTNSAGTPLPEHAYAADTWVAASWVDCSGPTGGPPPTRPPGPPEELPDLRASSVAYRQPGTGPWNGIALLDHPTNGGYPNLVGKYATVQQLTQAHYPTSAGSTDPFTFQQRVYVHDGDAAAARVDAHAAAFAGSCTVELR